MAFFKKILGYLNPATMFKKHDKEEGSDNVSLKMMHGMNRISIFMFLFCVIMMIYKFC
ncbi:MAG: DUF6728 family protein [Flavobacteriales bacterium]